MLKRTLPALAGALLVCSGAAQASVVYASAIDWQNNGTVGAANQRNQPGNALGAPDGDFLALGLSSVGNPGFAVFDFTQAVTGSVSVTEVTFNCSLQGDGSCSYQEAVAVFVGDDYAFGSNDFSDLSDFTLVGELRNGDAQSGASLQILGSYNYIALVDITNALYPKSRSTDGFDVDALTVEIGNSFGGEVPIPAAALLFAPALVGLARRRRLR